MKFRALIAGGLLLALTSTSAIADKDLEKCKETVTKFKELGNVTQMAEEAYGFAVLPTIGKAGMGIGGAGGKGFLSADGKQTGTVKMARARVHDWLAAGRAGIQPADPVQKQGYLRRVHHEGSLSLALMRLPLH